MRIKTAAEEEDQLNMTPLIDMVFLLLIFFLVATTIAQEEREMQLQLPDTSAVQPLSAPPKQLIINIMQDGTLKVSGRVFTRDELSSTLRTMAKDEPQREVLIRADAESLHKYFADVAQLCRKVGINELKIGYLFSGQGEQKN
jgi:biopolymer transport protein ExbD